MTQKVLLSLLFLIIGNDLLIPADSSIVAVIYNTNYDRGYEIASYYAEKRNIPENYLIGIPLSTDEVITKEYYYTMIRDPIKEAIELRGLKNKIKYLVTTKGMPLKIRTHQDYCNVYDQNGGGAIESFLCILFDDSTDFCSSPRIVNPYHDEGKPFESFTHEFIAYCPAETRGVVSYLVSRLDAYTPEDVLKMIDRSIASDTSSQGYYILDDHPGAAGYEPSAMKNAMLNLDESGLKEYVLYDSTISHISSDSLQNKSIIAYCSRGRHANNSSSLPPTLGWTEETGYLGGNNFNWLNGAVFTTYESFNGYSFYYADDGCSYTFPTGQKLGHRDHQNLVADFIKDGGTAGIGNVFEPFVSGVSRVDILYNYYAEGFNFIDAAYMSLRFLTGMNVVVGDPLCRISNLNYEPPQDTLIKSSIILEQNFPNPFSFKTTVRYRLTFSARVTLKIYNILGEEVFVIYEELRNPGTYDIGITFDAQPTGVYFYQLTAGGKAAAGKMLYLHTTD